MLIICLKTVDWFQILLWEPPGSSSLKTIWDWVLVFHQSNLKNTAETIISVLQFDMTNRMIGLGLSDRHSSPVKAKVEYYKSHNYFCCWVTDYSATGMPSSSQQVPSFCMCVLGRRSLIFFRAAVSIFFSLSW